MGFVFAQYFSNIACNVPMLEKLFIVYLEFKFDSPEFYLTGLKQKGRRKTWGGTVRRAQGK